MLLVGAAGFSSSCSVLALSTLWLTMTPVLVALGAMQHHLFTTTANSRLQFVTPPELRGRVMSLYTFALLGSTPIGSLCSARWPNSLAYGHRLAPSQSPAVWEPSSDTSTCGSTAPRVRNPP